MQHAERDGTQSRAAHLIEAPGGLLFGDTRLHGGLPRRVLPLAGREHLAEDHLVDFFARELCPLKGGLDGNRTKIMRGQVDKRAVERPDRGSLPLRR